MNTHRIHHPYPPRLQSGRTSTASRRTRTIDLDHVQLLIIENQPGARVEVYFGGLWLTEEHAAQDRIVTSGAQTRLRMPGRAVLQAIGRMRALVIDPAYRQGWHWARSLWHRARLESMAALRSANP